MHTPLHIYYSVHEKFTLTKIRLGMWINVEIFAPFNHTFQNRHKALKTFQAHAFFLILRSTFNNTNSSMW